MSRAGSLRLAVAAEAARLMYEEGVKQYFTAKRLAAKRLFGRVGGRRLRYRPQDLPSNGEIREALLLIADAAEGSRRARRLFAMRVVALETMRALDGFEPRLIGSVASGHVRRGSDVDLHVFTDDVDALAARVRSLGWPFTTERVSIWKGGAIRDYLHLHVERAFPVELTVYEPRELRVRPRSSTDGKPIVRVKPAALVALIEAEHAREWSRFQRDGVITGLDEAGGGDDDDDAPAGPYDGLLDLHLDADDDDVDPSGLVGLPGEGDLADASADEPYDPLPGFEDV